MQRSGGVGGRGGDSGAAAAARGVVLFSAQDYWYHNRAHSDVQLARALSSDRPVLLVNSLGMRMPRRGVTTEPWRRILRKVRSTLRSLRRPEPEHPDLWVLSALSVPVFGRPRLARLNAALVRMQVRAAGRLARIGTPDLVVTLPTAWDVAKRLSARSVVVNRSDRYSSLPEADSGLIERLEAEMLGACDGAVWASGALFDEERGQLEGDVEAVLLGHGVDLAHFAPRPGVREPDELRRIPHPRVGFFGGIDDYVVDLDLVARLAREVPEASIVLVGAATCSMDALVSLPNVHWLGKRPYDQIPAYGAGFDVAIMPWLQNEWIRFCNPIKTKEYLALGLPVVTTRYPEAALHEHVMAVADSEDTFIDLVKEAIAGNPVATPAQRREAVAEDSWDARADVLRSLLERAGNR